MYFFNKEINILPRFKGNLAIFKNNSTSFQNFAANSGLRSSSHVVTSAWQRRELDRRRQFEILDPRGEVRWPGKRPGLHWRRPWNVNARLGASFCLCRLLVSKYSPYMLPALTARLHGCSIHTVSVYKNTQICKIRPAPAIRHPYDRHVAR